MAPASQHDASTTVDASEAARALPRGGLLGEVKRRQLPRAALAYILGALVLVRGIEAGFGVFDLSIRVVHILRTLLVIGFPVALVLAWFSGAPPRMGEASAPPSAGRRHAVGIAIGSVGMLALGVVGYELFTARRSAPAGTAAARTVLVGDFENRTGEAVFDGTLEPALTLALGNGSLFSPYSRPKALDLAEKLNLPGAALPEQRARLVAAREGIAIVTVGLIEKADDGYTVALRAVDAATGEILFKLSRPVRNKQAVLGAVSKIAIEVREALDDAISSRPDTHRPPAR